MKKGKESDVQLEEVTSEVDLTADAAEDSYVEPVVIELNGMALVIADSDDILDRASRWFTENWGAVPAVYFVQGTNRIERKVAGKVEYDWKPQLFKIVNNAIGRAVVAVENDDLEFGQLEENCFFDLPRIPWSLVEKMDAFFRNVDKKLHTEGIVILTYDPQVGGHEGWGFIVPEQTNTTSSCKYEPDSIVDEKPDHVLIVGSAHSHPGMSAFASHTDVGDQLHFDGIHITFGWSGAKPTEHYIELQMGGGRFTLKPEQAFEYIPPAVEFPELDDLITNKVSKQSFSSTSYGGGANGSGYSSGYGHYGTSYTPSKIVVPAGCPDIKANTVIARLVDQDRTVCPVCAKNFRSDDVARRRCLNCMTFLALHDEGLKEVVEARNRQKSPSPELTITKDPGKPILLWERQVSDGTITEKVIELHGKEIFPKA